MQNRAPADQTFDIPEFLARRELPAFGLGAGETLFFKGDTAGGMYVVLAGRIDILIFGRLLDQVGRGGIIGEMALVDCTHRSAAALAQTDAELVAIDRQQFLALIAEEPRFALSVLAVMSARLRHVSKLFGEARQNETHGPRH
ncbi:MAG: Crp/Fnr family transcriptional regulator [Hyphomicrobiaceae bacterium]|nr:Crp/Fnr family transcriptional regulator [Hyphomicrobiaceae bacterium]